MRWTVLTLVLVLAAGTAWGQEKAIRDDAGDTSYQSIDGEGLLTPNIADAYGRLWVNMVSGTCGVQTEDAAHTSGDKGVFSLGVVKTTRAALSATDGDYTSYQLTSNGDVRTRDDDLHTVFGLTTTAKADVDGNGTAQAHLRRIGFEADRIGDLLGGGLPAALAAQGGLKIEGVASGTAVPVSGTFWQTTQPVSATQLPTALAANGGLKIEGVAGGVTVPVTEASAAAIAADLNELTAAPVEKTPTFLDAVIIGTPGTPTKIAANDNTFCTFVVFQAGRAAAANASPISITKSNGNYSQQKCIELCPGDTWSPPIPAGTKWDLNDFYVDGVNTDDGVRVLYVAP